MTREEWHAFVMAGTRTGKFAVPRSELTATPSSQARVASGSMLIAGVPLVGFSVSGSPTAIRGGGSPPAGCSQR
jgi:hypothetical protein